VNLVDSRVWIDFFRNQPTVQAEWLDRKLRSRGVTIRGTVDLLIATRCLNDGFRLQHSDRDFDAFETHLGLQVVDCAD